MAKETAEQKLLKIIEGKQGKSAAKVKKRGQFLSIRLVNQLLIAGVVVCIVLLVLEMQSGISLLRQDVELTAGNEPVRLTAEVEPEIRDLSFYMNKISERNIFKPYEETPIVTGDTESDRLSKKISKYKLVGVAWLDLPETASVMIENTETGMTYFLREGEKLDDVTIKTIYTDRAVLGYENEEITIKL